MLAWCSNTELGREGVCGSDDLTWPFGHRVSIAFVRALMLSLLPWEGGTNAAFYAHKTN